MSYDILVIDDEVDIREMIVGILNDDGYETRTAYDSDSAIFAVKNRKPSLIILDIWLIGSSMDGLALLDYFKKTDPHMLIIIISGHGNIETAVSAIKRGAYDYIEKPFKADRLIHIVERTLETSSLLREIRNLRQKSGEINEIIGDSLIINNLRNKIEKIATTNSRILIFGPSGSGKELVARKIHNLSLRAKSPFIVVNAATIIPSCIEEDIFGVEDSNINLHKIGALEEAHGGTVYFNEVSDIPIKTQNKILKVLIEQSFSRIGGNNKVKIDVRIISSTSHNIQEQIIKGFFDR